MRRIVVALCLMVTTIPATGIAGLAPAVAAPSMTASGSVNQVYVTDVAPGSTVELLDASSTVAATGTADTAGSFLFRSVTAAAGYKVRSGGSTVGPLTVTSPTDHPADSWYTAKAASEPIVPGFGYLTTRDGTTLSVNVTLPFEGGAGPWPVVINYSGYDPSQPGLPPQESLLYAAQGYVVVGVNMRGTGCSGGAFEFMETLQSLDGYDMVETIAHQTWSNGDVGLVGISYSGYSQLYVAATRPPHLRAITPLSPYSDTYSGILYPGGILNNGFAVDWAMDREAGAKPRARGWVKKRINEGDSVCDRNQALRLQSKPLLQRIQNTPFADHEYDYLNTETFVDQIQVPTYLASQWQDEQTGGSAANLISLFSPATKVYGSFTNGAHVEPMAPTEMFEAMVFIDLYVGHRVPHIDPVVRSAAPGVLKGLFGSDDTDAFAIPENPWASQPTWAAAKAAYEAQPRIRIKWENGAVPGKEGIPVSPMVTRHANWPLDGLEAEKLYLQPDGALAGTPATVADSAARAVSSYVYDPGTKLAHTNDSNTDSQWITHPKVHWNTLTEGNSLSFVTAPYTAKVAYAGQGSADLWVRSSAADTDFEVTLTEVRPDGAEVYIQSGWLRASHRTLDPSRSTELVPYQDHQPSDMSPLPAGQFTPVRIELFPFAHVVRPGSRLRVNVEVPGGNQPFWAFAALPGTATNTVGHSSGMPSRVVLPRVPGDQTPVVPAALPACSLPGVTSQSVSLRNQPCRAYVPARVPTAVMASAHGSSATVTWKAPAGPQPMEYRIVATRAAGAPVSSDAVPAPVTVPGTMLTAELSNLAVRVPIEVRVIAVYGSGPAPASDASLPVMRSGVVIEPTVPGSPPAPAVAPFSSVAAFVTQQLLDLTGSASPAAVVLGAAAIADGQAPGAYIAGLVDGPDARAHVDPVARLYLAYFRRLPEAGGLDYWSARHRSGLTLGHISASFAASSEFRNTYGSLGNAAFVDLIYQNVLGRSGDTTGRAYWIGELDARRIDRGRLMIGFSESPEYQRKVGNRVSLAHLYLAMLDRAPTPAEETAALDRLSAGTPLATIAAEILATPAYAARVR